jgi:phosphatidate cytidylyltransferase
MLKYRLIFGSLMLAVLFGLLYLDGKLSEAMVFDGAVFTALVALLAVPAQFEMRALAAKKGLEVMLFPAIAGSVILASAFFWTQFVKSEAQSDFFITYVTFTPALIVGAVFFEQAMRRGYESTIANCSATMLSIMYLGFLSSFIVGLRIKMGLAALLFAIITLKSSDIGAYTFGMLFGKRKFSPVISPGKSWEGLLGGAVFAAVIGFWLAGYVDFLPRWGGAVFGVVFAFIGQLGDLAESMLKRDAGVKDSANYIPGFGGILDIIDSPLVAAPFAYLYLSLFLN